MTLIMSIAELQAVMEGLLSGDEWSPQHERGTPRGHVLLPGSLILDEAQGAFEVRLSYTQRED